MSIIIKARRKNAVGELVPVVVSYVNPRVLANLTCDHVVVLTPVFVNPEKNMLDWDTVLYLPFEAYIHD